MTTQLRWIASTTASSFHATAALLQDAPPADTTLAAALAPAAADLETTFTEAGIDLNVALRALVPLSVGSTSRHDLADVLLRRVRGHNPRHELLVTRLAAVLNDIEQAQQFCHPQLVDELEVRSGPMRMQWEATGPGLLKVIGDLTQPDLIVETADVVLVHPFLGGDGAAHLDFNSVRLEAVLMNPIEGLPETLRLAWLVSQLNLDLPLHSETIGRDRLPLVAAASMLPAVLAAAEHLGIAQCNLETLALAVKSWRLPTQTEPTDSTCDTIAAAIDQWWQACLQKRVRPAVSLAALNQLLSSG